MNFDSLNRSLSKQVKISKLLIEKMEENRAEVASSQRKEFIMEFLSHKINGTVEHFALWFGLCSVWLVTQNYHATNMPKDSHGWTPLHIVSHEGHIDMVDIIISKFKDSLLETDYEGRTPLHLAAMNGHLKVVIQLVDAGTNRKISSNRSLSLADETSPPPFYIGEIRSGYGKVSSKGKGRFEIPGCSFQGTQLLHQDYPAEHRLQREQI